MLSRLSHGGARHSLGLAVACLLFVFVWGLASLKSTPIGWDEVNTAFHLFSHSLDQQRNMPETVASLAKGSPEHGPLYFALVNLWNAVAGSDLFVLRLLSLYIGTIGVAVAYRVASLTRDRSLGQTALIITSFLAFYLYFMLEIRPYALHATMSGWVILTYWRVLSASNPVARRKYLELYLSAALLLYVHYFAAFTLAAIGIYHLLLARRRANWWSVLMIMILAGFSFAPWLPVAMPALINPRHDLSDVNLSTVASLHAIALVFTNGLLLPPFVAGAFAFYKRKQMSQSEKYIVIIAVLAVVLIIAANQFVAFLVEDRLRYLNGLAIPIACATAIALKYVNGWRVLRFPLVALWIASFFAFSSSETYGALTGKRVQNRDKALHWQDFVYESESLHGHDELILGYYPIESGAVSKVLRYYRSILKQWAYLIVVWQNEEGEIDILSNLTTYDSLSNIAANTNALWVIHNPLRTDFESTEVYSGWLKRDYKLCRRYIEKAESLIDHYVKRAIPCELVTDQQPFAIKYENDTWLGNVKHEREADKLMIYLWWRRSLDGFNSVSLQAFDDQSNRVDQLDAVISGEPIDIFSIDTASLPKGDYIVKLIVYDFATKASYSGEIVNGKQRFERAVQIASFTVGE